MTISSSRPAKLPDTHQHAFHGGERAILYGVAEDMLSTFGMDGKACLLRAICEIHSKKSLDHLGLIGEVAKLFFTYVFDAQRPPDSVCVCAIVNGLSFLFVCTV